MVLAIGVHAVPADVANRVEKYCYTKLVSCASKDHALVALAGATNGILTSDSLHTEDS